MQNKGIFEKAGLHFNHISNIFLIPPINLYIRAFIFNKTIQK